MFCSIHRCSISIQLRIHLRLYTRAQELKYLMLSRPNTCIYIKEEKKQKYLISLTQITFESLKLADGTIHFQV